MIETERWGYEVVERDGKGFGGMTGR